MKLSKFKMLLGTVALLSASATTRHMSISDPVWLGQNELKAGEYNVEVNGDKAVIRSVKGRVEVPVKVETVPEKYDSTAWRTEDVNGKNELIEIRLGGTHQKVVLQTELAKPTS
jgi:hypothetical protein